MKDLSVYIHLPFCTRRCGYCDFNTNTAAEHLIPRYVDAVKKELAGLAETERFGMYQVHTIYLGGGTPTLVPPKLIGEILESVRGYFSVSGNCEITTEANPGTISRETVDGLVEAGINRVSIGMQSSVAAELLVLDREHKFDRVAEAVRVCREAGLENINLDLIYGIPGQTLASWEKSLLNALSLDPEHLSLYGLTIEEGTMLAQRVNRGLVENPDEDLAADLYEWAMGHLSDHGFEHYEISNWGRARPGKADPNISRHNLQYWMNDPYLGVGAGAHGFFGHERTENIPGLVKYLDQFSGTGNGKLGRYPAAASIEPISHEREMQETMMMGLRLLDWGVSEVRFHRRFGTGIEDAFASQIRKLIGLGLIEWAGEEGIKRLRLTRRASLVANQVFREFV